MDQPRYPHVFSSTASGNTLSIFGSKFALPVGTSRSDHKEYEEVTIPPPRPVPMRNAERLIPISEMEPLCRGAFPGYKSLNRLQSAVYPLGYSTNENLLVCAPTGAGKTDVAMLTVLRAISQYSADVHSMGGRGFGIKLNDFKVIYVAPMKALAAEVVRKFSKRLSYLGVKVRELTGDMQMTRQEIAETQMIVTTPEKWDVVTRKPTGEGELASKVKLLIIDEVHLLHEDRGAVIETIVARTLRLVESSQSLIRIVGLSATLPNYVDVADFLRVNRYQGLFYFDSSFRPVPLEQHFLGVKGKPGSPAARNNLDKATFIKVQQLIEEGHQVMIFVHARKETVKTALTIREMCRAEGCEDLLLAGRDDKDAVVNGFKRDLMTSRNKELKELFESGLGIHHAGMLRSDRNLSERMFETGITKVLCCTSTLAWGVNLPAYAVLIKGTEVYDSGLGKFTDLSILDVLQIFGRAGRPQYEDLGVGYILTPQEKLTHYVDAITSQHPIESKFDKGLIDSLNAECALGTVQSTSDAITWLSYTYLFTRMRRNPLAYGMSHDEILDDPHIGAKRLVLINLAAKTLVACKMLEVDTKSGRLGITELGRIAARYYIPWRTVEIFNEKLRPNMTEADVLSVLSLATDFEQIIPRDAEERELKKMLENAPCEVPGGIETSPGKVNILLQAYISRVYVEDFALASDTAYVAQNTGRIIRALFEISLSRRWPTTTASLMSMSKAVERRMWPFDHPLSQATLTQDTMFNIQRWADEMEITDLACMPAREIGDLIHLNERIGGAVRTAARQFPHLELSYDLKPITHDQLKVRIDVKRSFEWNDRAHGGVEAFYIWIEDKIILQWSRILVRPTTQQSKLAFTLSVASPKPAGLTIRWISDKWLGAEGSVWASFDELVMPAPPPPTSPLLDLPLLTVAEGLARLPSETRHAYLSRFMAFNAIQTQAFHTAMHARANMLLCAPAASGKSTLVEMAIWRQLEQDRTSHILVLVPQHRLLLQQAQRFAESFAIARSRVAASPGEIAKQDRSLREEVLYALPQHVLRVDPQHLRRFKLLVLEDLHLLNPAYELAVAHLRRVAATSHARFVATSASLHDATSFSEWLDVPELALYAFHAKDRPTPLTLDVQSFDLPQSFALLKMMAKPTYDRARAAVQAGKGPVLIFVPSRQQCLSTASDLVTRAASELNQGGFLGVDPAELEPYLTNLVDERLLEPLLHGIGVWHEGIHSRDRSLMLELFKSGTIKLLISPRESCWSLPVRAGLVVVMGARSIQVVTGSLTAKAEATEKAAPTLVEATERKVVDYASTDVIRMSSLASRLDGSSAGECLILCQGEQAEQLTHAVREGLPVESGLLEDAEATISAATLPVAPLLVAFVLRNLAAGEGMDAQSIINDLSWTLVQHRLIRNPSYYDSAGTSGTNAAARLSTVADGIICMLSDAGLIDVAPAGQDRPAEARISLLGRKLVKAFENNDDAAAVGTLLRLMKVTRQDPLLAAALCQNMLQNEAKRDKEEALYAQESVAIRDRIPGEWLAAFGIPRADRREKKARQQAADAAQTRQAEDHGTPSLELNQRALVVEEEQKLPIGVLLLAAFFSQTPIRSSSGGRIASSSTPHLYERQAALVIRVLSDRLRDVRFGDAGAAAAKKSRPA